MRVRDSPECVELVVAVCGDGDQKPDPSSSHAAAPDASEHAHDGCSVLCIWSVRVVVRMVVWLVVLALFEFGDSTPSAWVAKYVLIDPATCAASRVGKLGACD